MSIQWNKVTWYSKALAVILFVSTFYIGFYLGQQKNEIINKNKTSITPLNPVISSPPKIQTQKIKEENFSGTVPVFSPSSFIVEKARAYVTQTVSDFRKQANTDVPEMRSKFGVDSPPATYTIDIGATYVKSSKTESIVLNTYSYTGGANGNSSYKVITTSFPKGNESSRVLSLFDIIKNDQQDAFTEFVKKKLTDWRPEGSTSSVTFPEEVTALKFNSFSNWSLDNKNLTIYFDKYDIGPGVLGAVAFPLPLDEIRNFLN